jgi:RNA polymerase sigma-70 factor, ECF subfamily
MRISGKSDKECRKVYNCAATFSEESASNIMGQREKDRALLDRIRAGDMEACNDCVREHARGVYRLALRLLRNEAEAEDVMQETFLSAFKGISKFDGRSELRTWLYRIAHNAALMHLRRTRHDFVPVEETGDSKDGAPIPRQLFDWSRLPTKEFEKAEIRAELENAVGELPEALRAVFVMRELEDLSTDETAKALGVKIEVVKTRLHRARLRLRERLSGYFAAQASPAGR